MIADVHGFQVFLVSDCERTMLLPLMLPLSKAPVKPAPVQLA